MKLHSTFPGMGTTIFSVMSQLANEHRAVNLSQGFPDYACHPDLLTALSEAAQAGINQYAPMPGLPALREAIACKLQHSQGVSVCPDTEITVTAGATQALFTAIGALLHAGDEAIVLDPCYDSYVPSIQAQGALAVRITLQAPRFAVDWDAVARAITPRTRMIIVNNPNNPATSVFDTADLDALAAIAERHDLVVLSDEVYEHLVFDDCQHRSVLAHPVLRQRSLAVYSFGKTFHVTGWKIGYCVAAPALTTEFRKLHQFLVFSVNAPAQMALAKHMSHPAHWQGLVAFFEARRNRLAEGLQAVGFALTPGEGTYFQLADYSALRADLDDLAFARWLTEFAGVACIPLSPFFASGSAQRIVRFCFAKKMETLDLAVARLKAIARP